MANSRERAAEAQTAQEAILAVLELIPAVKVQVRKPLKLWEP